MTELKRDQLIIWLNDGAGHFSTLKAGDFVASNSGTWSVGTGRLVATRNGYSFIHMWINHPGGLTINGLLATKPYRITPHALSPRT